MAANRPQLACPHCGAPLTIRSPAAVLVICEYCSAAVYWDAQSVHSAGQQGALIEGFTRLYRGAGGSLEGQRFEVLGRIRYRSGIGLWDEWFIRGADEQTAWLTEDDHLLALQQPYAADLTHLAQQPAGARFELDGRPFEVDEVGEAVCVGVEGQLPARVLVGERYRYVDASSLDGALSLGVELDEQPPTSFLGRWLPHEAIQLDDEGIAW